MNIIFLEPGFPANQREFVRALHSIGAFVLGVGDRPYDWLDDELKSWLGAYQQIASVTDEGALEWAVRHFQDQMWIDRLEAVVEAHVLPAAHVRERCTIPGTSARTAYLCRDKVAMKEVLRRAGVPTAASAGVKSVAEARDFVEAVGFPVVIKPRDAAGASGTFRADGPAEFVAAARASGSGVWPIMRHHLLPNVLGPVLVFSSTQVSLSIILAAGLSFLGLGVTPPAAEWGLMLNTLRQSIYVNAVVPALPGLAIFVTSMAFNLVSDGLRDAMEIRS
jgi:hypothetical protein